MGKRDGGGIVKRPWVALLWLVAGCGILVSLFEQPRFHSFGPTCRPKVHVDMDRIRDALEAYAGDHGGLYPESLAVLVTADEQGRRYLSQYRLPRDPWNREYVYVPGHPPNVLTYGRDGVQGGTGEDADVDYVAVVGGR